MQQIKNIEEIIESINKLDAQCGFSLKAGIAEEVLTNETLSEKIRFLTYLQSVIYLSKIKNRSKIAIMGLFTIYIYYVLDNENK